MNQKILITIDLGGSVYRRYSSKDLEYPTSSPYHYEGRITDAGDISSSLSEMYFGTKAISNLTFALDNTDNNIRELRDNYELRGCEVTVQRVDIDAQTELDSHTLTITNVVIDPKKGTFTAVGEDSDVWKTIIPKERVTEDIFTSTVPVEYLGRPIHTWFGITEGVELYCIQEDTGNDYYDYLIGYGTLDAVTQVYREASGDARVDVSSSEYTFYDGSQGSPFPGYAFLRFIVQQTDSNDNYHKIWADIEGINLSGTSAHKNPVFCLKEFMTNSTWGLGLTVNASSFAVAATLLSSSDYYVGGGFWEFKKASEWRDFFLQSCRLAQLSKGASGYEIYIPAYDPGSEQTFDEHNMQLIKDSLRPSTEYVKTVRMHSGYRLIEGNYTVESSYSTGKSFGIEKEYYNPFTSSATGAENIAKLIRNRFQYQDRNLEFIGCEDAADLALHGVITINRDDLGLSNQRFEIINIGKRAKDIKMTAAKYSSSIFIT